MNRIIAVITAIKKRKLKDKSDRSAFVYGMALHTVADIFAHSAAGVKGQNREKLKKKSVKKLAKKWKYSAVEIAFCTVLLVLCISSLAANTYNPFIYFRF